MAPRSLMICAEKRGKELGKNLFTEGRNSKDASSLNKSTTKSM